MKIIVGVLVALLLGSVVSTVAEYRVSPLT
jgi:hypothetical protein